MWPSCRDETEERAGQITRGLVRRGKEAELYPEPSGFFSIGADLFTMSGKIPLAATWRMRRRERACRHTAGERGRRGAHGRETYKVGHPASDTPRKGGIGQGGEPALSAEAGSAQVRNSDGLKGHNWKAVNGPAERTQRPQSRERKEDLHL